MNSLIYVFCNFWYNISVFPREKEKKGKKSKKHQLVESGNHKKVGHMQQSALPSRNNT